MSGRNNVEDTVRDFWATRPHRPVVGRKIGGVAAGIGRRYRIDPVLVRVAFVVTTLLSGAGLLLYLLGWLLLPAEGDEVSTVEGLLGRGHSSMSPALTVLLGLALVPATGLVLEGPGFGVLGLAVAGVALFLLHRSRAAPGEVSPPEATPVHDIPAHDIPAHDIPAHDIPAHDIPDPLTADMSSANSEMWVASPARQPVASVERDRPKVTPITLGLALLAGGIAVAFWPALPTAHVFAIMLGIVGVGLVIGSLMREGRGLIAIAIPLALLIWMVQAVPAVGSRMGDHRWVPTATAHLASRYDITAGTGILDLSGLRIADGRTVATSTVVGMGDLRVILPPDVDAQVVCLAYVGDVDCLRRSDSGFASGVDVRDFGLDGPGGGTLILDARAGVGSVAVERY